MKNPFLPYCLQPLDIFESTATEDLKNINLLNARWVSDGHFVFDAVKKDKNGDEVVDKCEDGQSPAYKVYFAGNPYGSGGVSISFYRCDSTSDNPGNFGPQVFLGVQKAMYDYVTSKKPFILHWGPVSRSGGEQHRGEGAERANIRGRVYDLYAKTHLFPEKYVSVEINKWIRRDIYDKTYAKQGFPAIPDGIDDKSKMADKTRLLSKMRNEAFYMDSNTKVAAKNAVFDFIQEEQKKEEERAAKQKAEALRRYLDDPQYNPNRVEVGDLVWVPDDLPEDVESDVENVIGLDVYKNQMSAGLDHGKIVDINLVDEKLIAKLYFVNEDNSNEYSDYYVRLPITLLEKYEQNEEKKKERLNARNKKYLDSIDLNPNQFEVGDEVIVYFDLIEQNRTSAGYNMRYGDIGKIVNIKISHDSGLQVVLKVQFDGSVLENVPLFMNPIVKAGYHASISMRLRADERNILKKTPENTKKVQDHYKKTLDLYEKARNGENPWGLKVGDKVVANEAWSFIAAPRAYISLGRIGKVKSINPDVSDNYRIWIYWERNNVLSDEEDFRRFKNLSADQVAASEQEYGPRGSEFVKLTPESEEEIRKKFKEKAEEYYEWIKARRNNPDGLKVGDKVVLGRSDDFEIKRFANERNYVGNHGEVASLYVEFSAGDYPYVVAEIKMEGSIFDNYIGQQTLPIPLNDKMYKILSMTPANIMAIKKDMQLAGVSKDVTSSKQKLGNLVFQYDDGWSVHRTHPSNPENIQKNDVVNFKDSDGKEHEGRVKSVGFPPVIGSTPYAVANIEVKPGTDVKLQAYGPNTYTLPTEKLRLNQAKSAKSKRRKQFISSIRKSSPDVTNSLSLGTGVVVTAGPHQDQKGYIVGWRPTSSGFARAVIQLEPTESGEKAGKIEVLANLLDRVPSMQSFEHRLNLLKNLQRIVG